VNGLALSNDEIYVIFLRLFNHSCLKKTDFGKVGGKQVEKGSLEFYKKKRKKLGYSIQR